MTASTEVRVDAPSEMKRGLIDRLHEGSYVQANLTHSGSLFGSNTTHCSARSKDFSIQNGQRADASLKKLSVLLQSPVRGPHLTSESGGLISADA